MPQTLLVLNAGSSTLKFTLFVNRSELAAADILCDGGVEERGEGAQLTAKDAGGTGLIDHALPGPFDHHRALDALLRWLSARFAGYPLRAAGHRVVHGGTRFVAPVRVDGAILAQLRALIPLAPLHQGHNIAAIEALAQRHPDLPQIACFDTAFHSTQPELATCFALPQRFHDRGLRRYGFHGLSYEYIASVLPQVMGAEAAAGRVIVAHLGSGASLCALKGGQSQATTMSFTPLDGLMMATRCGSLDPGVLLYLLQEEQMSAPAVRELLYHQSGLLGVSGISDDMRVLLASPSAQAARAIDLFVYRIVRELGSLAAALGGLDALVFTAGIGAHAAEIRRRVCLQAAWLGIHLDDAANRAGGPCISDSAVSAWVIPTNESLMIARHVVRRLQS